VIDNKGNKLGKPFKSSLFGKEAGFEALQKHFETSKLAIEKEKIKERLHPVVTKAMQEAKNKRDFTKWLKENRVGVIFRTNEQGRIYGVTFMDYQNRAVLNGSRLGKEFSANVFNELFNNQHKQSDEMEHKTIGIELKHTEAFSFDLSLGSVFSLLDMPQTGGDYEAENFAREQEYEAKRRKLKAKKKGRRI
jgi:hypothetical protein